MTFHELIARNASCSGPFHLWVRLFRIYHHFTILLMALYKYEILLGFTSISFGRLSCDL
jgi:hypothetical protein